MGWGMARPPRPTRELLRVGVHDARMAPAAEAAARAAASTLGFTDADADRLAAAVAVTCQVVAEHTFDDPAASSFDVTLLDGPAGLVVRVSDEGLPFSLAPEVDGEHLAARVAAATAGEGGRLVEGVEVAHLEEGTSIELHVRADPSVLTHLASDDVGTDPVVDAGGIVTRPLRREDCESLARCVWRVYRYSYVADYLYHPDRVWSLVEAGSLRSWVAVDGDGEVVGHLGLLIEEPDTRVADASLALTDPRYRHHHVMEDVGRLMADAVEDLELVGTFAEAVTTHTITQRGMVRQGGVETGVLLGFIPATMSYRGIMEDLGGNRQSAVLGYHPVRVTPQRSVTLPDRYADELRRVYRAAGLDRVEVPATAADGPTELRIEVDGPRQLATLVVTRPGSDVVDVIDRHRRQLCAAGMELVYAELPLGDPASAAAVDGLVERGFFYGGVIPELRDDDVLRLQYLDVEVDPSVIQLYSDEARRILDMTLADRG
jgi:hypothetical protein